MKKGYNRTMEQCREKIKKLKKEYRHAVDNNNETGRHRKTCKFFNELDDVLGTKPATAPKITISSETIPSLDDDDDDYDECKLSPLGQKCEFPYVKL